VFASSEEAKAFASYKKNMADWAAADVKMLELSSVNNASMAEDMFREQVGKPFEAAMKDLDVIAAFNAQEADSVWADTQKVLKTGKVTVIGALVAALAIGALLAILISRSHYQAGGGSGKGRSANVPRRHDPRLGRRWPGRNCRTAAIVSKPCARTSHRSCKKYDRAQKA